MIATLLFCALIITLGQFGFYYWRTRMRSVSALPVSDRVRVAARISTSTVGSHDFEAVVSIYNLVPGFRGSCDSLRGLRAYYALVEKLGRWIPPMANWSEAEMTRCSRYAAVLVDQHFERNLASASPMLVR